MDTNKPLPANQRKFSFFVSVLRSASDCTLNGVSVRHEHFILVGPDGPPDGGGQWKADSSTPMLKVVERRIGSHYYWHAEPVGDEAKGWMMAGGNFVYSCDSRYREVFPFPIPVHDRFEGGRR